jgi:hypothetical protein
MTRNIPCEILCYIRLVVVPVPANPQRAAERHVDIVSVIASSFANRIGLPVRSDLLKRTEGALSREVDRSALSGQYRIDSRKGAQLRDRTVLVVDDVVTRGNTASICAEKLKELGCQKVYLLTLAQSKSTAKSNAFLGESVSGEAQELAGCHLSFRLKPVEPKFTCRTCGHRGADVRPLFESARMGTEASS